VAKQAAAERVAADLASAVPEAPMAAAQEAATTGGTAAVPPADRLGAELAVVPVGEPGGGRWQ
jgi:hypothetical protein